jgi:hypothetical protein
MESIIIEPIVSVRSIDILPNATKPIDNTWKSCCFSINPSAVKYFVQVGILAGLIIYSATMLVVNPTCESQRNYGSLLMVCLGCFLPTPKMN